ncbi:Outer membrane cobalamin receptor protein [Arenibacter nanhaiticus]|uniref:Outer membrane cobalamin receptor protein n=1 Tax=Arenibacter nanhaiticus TaxID=558155 RepID=A0A1M6B1M1_9FLAO|nr:TonB-dependent receptor [Arenibacter nanhaiticus]SHI42567.1 Outer membrane cobalamin receptor protein [Arenibacter nanhaiticus]
MYFYKHKCLWVRVSMLLSLMIFSFLSPAFAQEFPGNAKDSLDIIKGFALGEVIVTATKVKFSLASPMPVQILSGKKLEKLNSLSVADAIRYFSGVQLKDYGGIGGIKTINVRSLGSAHTAVFYDGMSVGNAQNGQVDLGKFSLDNIESIELYNGQKSTIFQPARGFFSSNTLFLRTKAPQFSKDKNYRLKPAFKTGSFGLVNPSLLYQQKLSPALSLSASAERVEAHGRYKYNYRKEGGYDTTAVRQNGDITSLRTEMTLHVKLRRTGQASIKTYLYDSERGLPGAIVANRYHHVQRQWDRNFFIHASLHNSFSKKHNLLANIKFSNDYNRYLDPDYKTNEGALDNKYYQNELYTSLVNQYSLRPWWDVSLATDFSLNTLSANLYRFPYPSRYSYLGALSSHMRWEGMDLQANLLAGYIKEDVKHYQQGDNQSVLSPVISVSAQPFKYKAFRVRAFYKESFRMPTFNDLYYTFIGNSSLRPEVTTQYDVGATWTIEPGGVLQSASVQTDIYYNKVKDKIVAMPSSNLFRWTMLNLGEVDIKGLEAKTDLGFKLSTKLLLDLGLNYTYQKAIDITPNGSTYGHQIPYAPEHSATLTSSVLWKNWQMNYSFIYTGERYSQKANIPVNYVQPWYTSDIALNWEGTLVRIPVKIGAEVNNFFNQYYDVVLNFPMPGRNYRINLAIEL